MSKVNRVHANKAGPSYGEDFGPLIPSLWTYEIPVFTGVFDSTGSPIFRNNNPIGFGRDNEWKRTYLQPKS